MKVLFPKLTTTEKIDVAIMRLKKKGLTSVYARDVAKIVNMSSGRAASLMKQSERVKYDTVRYVWILQ
jgi:hypothetical protein